MRPDLARLRILGAGTLGSRQGTSAQPRSSATMNTMLGLRSLRADERVRDARNTR